MFEDKGTKCVRYRTALIEEDYRQGELRLTLEVKEHVKFHL